MASSASRAGRVTDRRAQAKRRRRRALWCLPILLALAAFAIYSNMGSIAADLAVRSRAALRAANFLTVEVAFNGREAMVRGHVADGLHMAAVETIIEGQRGVRWADLRAVTIGGAPAVKPLRGKAQNAAPQTVMPGVAAPQSASPTSQVAPSAPPSAALALAGSFDGGPAGEDAGITPDAALAKPATLALSWASDGLVLDAILPSEAAQAQVVKAVTALLGDADWEDQSDVGAGDTPGWLSALIETLPQLRSIKRLTLRIDAHVISVGGAVVDDAVRARVEGLLNSAFPQHVVHNTLTLMAPAARVAARMHAVRGLDLFFGPDGVNLTEDGAAELTKIAAALKDAPGAVRVESHTDNVGKGETSQARSDARAAVVHDFLRARGVPSARLRAVGRGARAPIADNSTEDGRALNRRIVIILAP